jgi:mycobactin salicyl-AMP ligase
MSILATEWETDARAEPRLTAEGLLRRRAAQRPLALAIADPPSRDRLGLGVARSFTYAEADAAVDALAQFFIALGLKPGDRMAIQLPNIAEQALTILAAWRAGLTALMLPMLWRRTEIGRVVKLLEPKALLGVGRFGGENVSETLCEIAVTQLSVRYVFGFGARLADGVTALDEALLDRSGVMEQVAARERDGPALITFTARAGEPLLSVFRNEDELLAQGAMTVLALALTTSDVILNPYPLTGPVGLGLGLMPWLISGSALVQHQPFAYAEFLQQLLTHNATVTALPSPVLAALAEDGVLADPDCTLKRVGMVWSVPELTQSPRELGRMSMKLFDVYPLGDLASLVRHRDGNANPSHLPLGRINLGEGPGTMFAETTLGPPSFEGPREILVRGPIVPHGAEGTPLAPLAQGYVATGWRGVIESGNALKIARDTELLHHGGITIAASELDALYRSFPGYLDAACFTLPDPIVGDRIFAAIVPKPDALVSLEALQQFLRECGVAPYKDPDQLLVVRTIPRDANGKVLREEILSQV